MATNSYRLGDADRERLGAPEWMPFELMDVTLGQITELSDRFGFELEDWPGVFVGPAVLVDGDGEVADRRAPKWQLQCAIWLALHQSGINVPWEDVGDIAVLRVQSRLDDSPGKDEGSSDSPPSPTPGPSTTPPSSTSSLVLVEEN